MLSRTLGTFLSILLQIPMQNWNIKWLLYPEAAILRIIFIGIIIFSMPLDSSLQLFHYGAQLEAQEPTDIRDKCPDITQN